MNIMIRQEIITGPTPEQACGPKCDRNKSINNFEKTGTKLDDDPRTARPEPNRPNIIKSDPKCS